MSVDAFYGVRRAGASVESLFRSLCHECGVEQASLSLQPASLADVEAAVTAFGLADAFTQVTCEEAINDAGTDLKERLRTLPPLAPPADDMESLTLRYEVDERTAELWPVVGKKRRTAVVTTFAVGADLSRPAVAFGCGLDYSMVLRVSDAENAAIQGWWRARHHAFLDARLATLDVTARFDLDVNEPAVLSSSSTEVSIRRAWGHLSYPVVLLARSREALLASTTAALSGVGATRVLVDFQGPARALAPLRAWLPRPSVISGPAIWDPLPLSGLKLPNSFSGEASLSAIVRHDDDGGDLMLFLGKNPRLVLAVRSALLPDEKRALEKRWRVQLAHEHD